MLLVSILLQGVSLLLSYRVGRGIFSAIFLANIILSFNFIGAVLSVSQYGNYWSALLLSLGTFGITFGAILADKIFNKSYFVKTSIAKNRTAKIPKSFIYAVNLTTMVILALCIIPFLRSGIPIFANNPDTARMEIGQFCVRSIIVFLPFIILVVLNDAFRKRRLSAFFMPTVLLLLEIVFLFFLGNKGFILSFILLLLMFLEIKVSFNRPFLKFFALLLIVVGISSTWYMTKITFHKSNAWTLNFLIDRTTIKAVQGFNIIVYDFVPEEGIQYGKTIMRGLTHIPKQLGLTSYNADDRGLGEYLWDWYLNGYNPYRMAYTTTILGDFYINFGLIGLVLLSLGFGSLVQYLHILSYKLRNNDLLFSLIILTEWILLHMVGRGSIGAIITYELSSLILVLILLASFYIILSLPTGKVVFRLYMQKGL